jgi:hypothetical protein
MLVVIHTIPAIQAAKHTDLDTVPRADVGPSRPIQTSTGRPLAAKSELLRDSPTQVNEM